MQQVAAGLNGIVAARDRAAERIANGKDVEANQAKLQRYTAIERRYLLSAGRLIDKAKSKSSLPQPPAQQP
jgi:hypothetical protein